MTSELSISYRTIEDLVPYSKNPRTHSKKQIEQIKKSIENFGFTNPILIDGANGIIAGHGRIQAAKQLHMSKLPCIELSTLTPTQKRAYIIADNKLAENAGWDKDLLKIEFAYLTDPELNFDVSLTGFDIGEIDFLIQGNDLNTDPEIILPETTVSEIGDIWQLGNHRIMCGSALEPHVFSSLLEDKKAHLVFTDPPYNVPVSGHICGKGSVQHAEFAMASGEMSPQQFTDFLEQAFKNLIQWSNDGSIHFICMDWRHMTELMKASKYYSELKNVCVWNKNNGGMGSLYRSKHELVFVYKNGTSPHTNNIELGRHGRYRTNVWDYAGINSFSETRDEELSLHPTVKPIQLIADAILDCSNPDNLILDCFGGSGSTLLAAEKTKRIAYLIEIAPLYVDVTIERYEKMTGNNAIHIASGMTFSALSDVRKNPIKAL